MKLHTRLLATVAAIGLSAAAAPAFAAPCAGTNVGTATTSDVTFEGIASDACVISGVNPQQGPNGNTSGFDGTFGTGWSLLAKLTNASGTASLDGVNFSWGFAQTTSTVGTWTLTSDKNAEFDLVFAIHASDNSGAFLFDDQVTLANQSNGGTWVINWVNGGTQVPGFSNATLFARDLTTPVPEPETYALFLAGLGAMGFVAKRRRKTA
jgi:hypothetical protein